MTTPWYQDEKAALERELDDDTTCNNGKKSVGTNKRSFHLTTDPPGRLTAADYYLERST